MATLNCKATPLSIPPLFDLSGIPVDKATKLRLIAPKLPPTGPVSSLPEGINLNENNQIELHLSDSRGSASGYRYSLIDSRLVFPALHNLTGTLPVAELCLYFRNQSQNMTGKILCICLGLAIGKDSEAPYFTALSTSAPLPYRPLLTSLFESEDTFIEYVGADLRGRTYSNPNPNAMCDPVVQSVTYFVCTGQGILGSQATLNRLKGYAGSDKAVLQTVTTLPADLVSKTSLVYGIHLGLDTDTNSSATPTSALKCYRLNVAQDVKNGTVNIGNATSTSTLQDELVAAQMGQDSAVTEASSSGFQPGDVESILAIIIAVILGIGIILWLLDYFYPGGLAGLFSRGSGGPGVGPGVLSSITALAASLLTRGPPRPSPPTDPNNLNAITGLAARLAATASSASSAASPASGPSLVNPITGLASSLATAASPASASPASGPSLVNPITGLASRLATAASTASSASATASGPSLVNPITGLASSLVASTVSPASATAAFGARNAALNIASRLAPSSSSVTAPGGSNTTTPVITNLAANLASSTPFASGSSTPNITTSAATSLAANLALSTPSSSGSITPNKTTPVITNLAASLASSSSSATASGGPNTTTPVITSLAANLASSSPSSSGSITPNTTTSAATSLAANLASSTPSANGSSTPNKTTPVITSLAANLASSTPSAIGSSTPNTTTSAATSLAANLASSSSSVTAPGGPNTTTPVITNLAANLASSTPSSSGSITPNTTTSAATSLAANLASSTPSSSGSITSNTTTSAATSLAANLATNLTAQKAAIATSISQLPLSSTIQSPPDEPYNAASKKADADLLKYLRSQQQSNTFSGVGLDVASSSSGSQLSASDIDNAINQLVLRNGRTIKPDNSDLIRRARQIYADTPPSSTATTVAAATPVTTPVTTGKPSMSLPPPPAKSRTTVPPPPVPSSVAGTSTPVPTNPSIPPVDTRTATQKKFNGWPPAGTAAGTAAVPAPVPAQAPPTGVTTEEPSFFYKLLFGGPKPAPTPSTTPVNTRPDKIDGPTAKATAATGVAVTTPVVPVTKPSNPSPMDLATQTKTRPATSKLSEAEETKLQEEIDEIDEALAIIDKQIARYDKTLESMNSNPMKSKPEQKSYNFIYDFRMERDKQRNQLMEILLKKRAKLYKIPTPK